MLFSVGGGMCDVCVKAGRKAGAGESSCVADTGGCMPYPGEKRAGMEVDAETVAETV